ncbi:hypothetical protein VZT92_016658 [Zoarces viviparus]|uniref:Uncharacterized protein n=1 Tax=Zoarces viviparus TaxID=48416 RepID=A0AAW1ETB8_ZOAVI
MNNSTVREPAVCDAAQRTESPSLLTWSSRAHTGSCERRVDIVQELVVTAGLHGFTLQKHESRRTVRLTGQRSAWT